MKILQIVPYFPPYCGGQERYVYNLSKYLVNRGHEVHVATSDYPANSKKDDILDGITISRYKCLGRPLRNPITPGMLTLINELEKFDLVHTHNEHSFAAMVAAYLRRSAHKPSILTCHGQLKFGSKMTDNCEKIYSKYIGKYIFNTMDSIVVNSSMDQEYVQSINPRTHEKITILHNAIDQGLFKRVNENVNKSQVNISLNDFKDNNFKIVLFVGRMIKRKGLEWLIKAIDIIVNNFLEKKLFFIMVGEGEDLNYFKHLVRKYDISNYILFLQNVTEDDLICLYRCSDIFVLPSLSEVCPTVVLEAMHFGLPVVSTDIPGVVDHFEDVALLVPPRNETKLANAIINLIYDEELQEKLSKIGNELIKSRYTWDVVGNEYEKIYLNMIEGAK